MQRSNGQFLTLVRTATVRYQAARRVRDEAITAAVRAGVNRQMIADAAGLSKPRVDQIARGE